MIFTKDMNLLSPVHLMQHRSLQIVATVGHMVPDIIIIESHKVWRSNR